MVFLFLSCNCKIGISRSRLNDPCLASRRVRSIETTRLNIEFPTDNRWSFDGGSRVVLRPQLPRRRCFSQVHASWLATSQITSGVFTSATVAVLPFYALMVVAPKAQLTKKSMESGIPFIILGLLYCGLLYLSWTPDTLGMIFASKYMLPEFPGIVKMFGSEMTLASAWIHLLAIDLFAARQVFHDGLENQIETRHSVSLCLFFCPIGLVVHFITKALIKNTGDDSKHSL